eukprot:216396-Lingulodinium_polyedra.AAC.1
MPPFPPGPVLGGGPSYHGRKQHVRRCCRPAAKLCTTASMLQPRWAQNASSTGQWLPTAAKERPYCP